MLKNFFKIMLGFKKDLNNAIPDSYCQNIYQINFNKLKEKQIDTILFDVDNTLTYVDDINIPVETINLIDDLKKQNFKILLLSNNHEPRVKPISKALNIPMIYEANKPRTKSYIKALQMLNSKKENTVAIGDQILTDIIGAKRYGIKAILVDQLSNENNIKTGIAHKLQNHIVKKLSQKHLFKQGKYYQ